MENKKQSKFKNWLKETAPHVLNIVGDVLPDKGWTGVVKNIIQKDEQIDELDRLEGLALLHDFEMAMEKEMTKRITGHQDLEKVQLQQEDKFTKRARPTRQYFWLLFLLICYPISMWSTGSVIELPEIVLGGVFVDFGLYTWKRSEEKLKGKGFKISD